MSKTIGYGQYCPIALTSEIVCKRWTTLVLRAFFCGASTFSEIQKGVPLMSSALLASRLKELEHCGIIEQIPPNPKRGKGYQLTEAGKELFPVLDQMGIWAQNWLRREITLEHNLDPDILMWELRQLSVTGTSPVSKRRVAQFLLSGVPSNKQQYWLVFEPENVEICVKDPGYEIDIWISAHIRTLVEIWLGHTGLQEAREDQSLRLDGSKAEIDAFKNWFCLSHFASVGAAAKRGIGDTL